jgi:c-di-AMP phosphodiesterase-like protein
MKNWLSRLLKRTGPSPQKDKPATLKTGMPEGGLMFRIIKKLDLPMAMIGQDGDLLWANDAYLSLLGGYGLTTFTRTFDPRFPANEEGLRIRDKALDLYALPIPKKDGEPGQRRCFVYLIDRTKERTKLETANTAESAILFAQIDNYEELAESDLEAARAAEAVVTESFAAAGGVCRRYERGKYFIVMERHHVMALRKKKFSMLDAVRDIKTSSAVPVTISVAVGIGDGIQESERCARKAMELALGRGGGQCVVNEKGSFSFFGGRVQIGERHSRVKTRVFVAAMSNLIAESDQVLIMGHRSPDFDCAGAALGVARCTRALEKPVHMIVEDKNAAIIPFLNELASRPEYDGFVIPPDRAERMMTPDTLVFLVDTQRQQAAPAPELLDRAKSTIVIDHHRKGLDSFPSATLQYTEPSASSTCELVAESIQYFKPDVRLTPFEASMLMAGLMVDTKNFTVAAGARAFEVAGYLRRCGADAAFVRQLRQDDIETYVQRAAIVKNARMLMEGVAVSVCPKGLKNPALLAAQAADTLTTIKGIEVAFVVAESEGNAVVSARSIGEFNVQLIMEAIGGGGQLNVAGALLTNCTAQESEERLTAAIWEYVEGLKAERD